MRKTYCVVASIFCFSLFLSPSWHTTTVLSQDNIGHGRHFFKHGGNFPVVPAKEPQFTTNRQSDVAFFLPREENSFSFLVFADRTSGMDDKVSVLADAVRDANLLEPDLVMNIGDMVQGYNTTEEWIPQMLEYKSIMKELYCPWFPTVGNHEMYWRGPDPPENLHEASYEKYFGPLWYAFEYQNCWFIVLFTDETNPKDGKKSFASAEYTKMSDAQFQWLKETLQKAKGADHVFVFQHHPRWRGGKSYGENWEPVHQLLAEAGNVSAVFAGHIHFMDYAKRDGIEYVTLATTGGRINPETAPRSGYLDEFHLVTVRKNRIAMAAIPVSAMLDPREITQTVHDDASKLFGHNYVTTPVVVAGDGKVDASVTFPLENFTSFPLDAVARLCSEDSRWEISSHPQTVHLSPGEKRELKFDLKRAAGTMDWAFREPVIQLDLQSRLPGSVMPIPQRTVEIPLDLRAPLAHTRRTQQATLEFFGHGDKLRLPGIHDLRGLEQVTLETWFCAKNLDGKRVLIGIKANTTELALQLIDGTPRFVVPFGSLEVLNLDAEGVRVEPNRWYHLAGVYDGKTTHSVKLYLDGRLVAKQKTKQSLFPVPQAVILGSEIDRDRLVLSSFEGRLDSVRFSNTARYAGESVDIERDFTRDDATLLLLDMQENVGLKIPVLGVPGEFGLIEGDAKVVLE